MRREPDDLARALSCSFIYEGTASGSATVVGRRTKQVVARLTSCAKAAVSCASSNVAGLPSMEKWSFRIEGGVGEAAKGYILGSKSSRCRGARSIRGGNLVVVVVVVVTTVVCVAGP